MSKLRVDGDLCIEYVVDDYTDTWGKAETIVLLHGLGERGAVWYGWVPHLGRELRVVRPDLRGFGDATAMPAGFPWSVDLLVGDCLALIDALGSDRCAQATLAFIRRHR